MRFMRVLAVALITMAGWSTSSMAADPSWPKEITFALLSTENASEITRRWGPILAQLEKDLGVKVKPVTATDYRGSIEALKFIREHQEESVAIASKWLRLDLATTRAAFENYLPCYSADGSLTDQALKDLVQYELDRGTVKKDIPLSQVASRDLLLQAQKELGIR